MFIKDNKRWNKPYSRGTTEIDGVRYPNTVWDDPTFRAAQGVTEIPDPQLPEGVSDETHYIHTLNEAPWFDVTPKSDEQIATQNLSKAATAAQMYLDSTDYLFSVDRNAKLLADEPDRAAELITKREEARVTVRLWKSTQVRV